MKKYFQTRFGKYLLRINVREESKQFSLEFIKNDFQTFYSALDLCFNLIHNISTRVRHLRTSGLFIMSLKALLV